ncbi:glycosyltransferase [Candidatus Saccharibacteria bacterium]|nr:glycosyltransferase [Candidatus Saccharibacteria bacterium]
MKKPLISIIVPCYNREQYIEKCLKSLLHQTMSEIEVVFVDDGSTDSSLQIAKRLQKNDPRLKIHTGKNRGVAIARNIGLKNSRGQYIMACDSDDFFEPNMCQRMYRTIVDEKVDCVICAMKVIHTNKNSLGRGTDEYVKLKFKGKQIIDWNKIIHTDVSIPNKIFKKSIIDKYHISYPEGLLFEDAFFCDQYFTVSKTIFYLDEKLYNYVRHDESIMSQSFSKKGGQAADYMKIADKTYAFLQKNQLFDKYIDFFWHRFIQYYAFARDNLRGKDFTKMRKEALDFIATHQAALDQASPHIKRDTLNLIKRTSKTKDRLRKITPPIIKRVIRKITSYS